MNTRTIRRDAIHATGQAASLGFTRLLARLQESLGFHPRQRHVDRAGLQPAARAIDQVETESLVAAEQLDDQRFSR